MYFLYCFLLFLFERRKFQLCVRRRWLIWLFNGGLDWSSGNWNHKPSFGLSWGYGEEILHGGSLVETVWCADFYHLLFLGNFNYLIFSLFIVALVLKKIAFLWCGCFLFLFLRFCVEDMESKEMNLNKECGGAGIGNSKSSGDGFIDRSKVRILLCDNDSNSSDAVFSLLVKCSYQGIFWLSSYFVQFCLVCYVSLVKFYLEFVEYFYWC